MKRSTQCKTYGRTVVSSKQALDFDRVFRNVTNTDSIGNSPFSSSDSSAGKSFTVPTGHYNFRRKHACTEKDNTPDSFLNESSSVQNSPETPLQIAPKPTSQRNRLKGKRTGRLKEVKKIAAKQSKKVDLNEKENSSVDNVPDYDAIAEDSLVVESENHVDLTKCSTPVVNSLVTQQLINDSEKMPTPIFRVLRSSRIPLNEEDRHDDDIDFLQESDCESANVTTRRPSRLQNKRVSTRKILIDEDSCPMHFSSLHHSPFDDSGTHLYSLKDIDEISYNSSCNLSTNDSNDDLLKSIGENINSFAKINLSIDNCEVIKKKTSPVQELPSPNQIFDASDDLFESHANSNTNLEGLSCICEENEELKSSLKEESVYEVDSLNSTSGAQKHLSESFYDKIVSHSICENEKQTAQEKLMHICEQEEYVSFSESIPSKMMSTCVKIGEGVYGEVFRSVSRDTNVAIKIIPMEGNFSVNDCPQKTFDEILPEAVIAKELSDLANGSYNLNFCQVNRMSCVQGSFPAPLLKQWDAYAKRKVSENDRPDFFPEDQLFMVFEFIDGGMALENFEMSNHRQTLSVLRQTVFALAVAESALEFEHRDLHIGNILVRPYQEENVKFMLCGEEIEFPSEGVFATIIDFTISRLKKDGCAVFCDVSADDGLFEGSGDFQFDVYRDMKKENENDWNKFCPHSNVLWVKYLCRKLLAGSVKDNGRDHRDSQRRLRQLNETMLKYESCMHMALDHDLWQF